MLPEPPVTIGPYTISHELGRGGMGVVYLARDARLDRDVAIKALPDELSEDPARLDRFEREAKTLAQLNHPNIAGLYGLEESQGKRYLVLEYVDGQTLADRLDRGPLPLDEALEIAGQVASGVEAAHDAGVIHRDLKPGNIIITPDGRAKVLDFGLARTDEGSNSSSGLSKSPTLTGPPQHSPTIPGAILGTAAYMSPEQARGRRVDRRTDIWSFGVVLFEMLAGAGPFVGETASDSIGAVLHKQLDLGILPRSTPAHVRRVLSRCLERDRNLRYRDIGDVRLDLLQPQADFDQISASPPASRRKTLVTAVVLAILLSGLSSVAAWSLARSSAPRAEKVVRKLNVATGGPEESFWTMAPSISPDGRRIAFIQDESIYFRDLSEFESKPVPGTDGANKIFWSPDGRWLGFTTKDGIFRLPASGGGATRILDIEVVFAPVWTDQDRIVVSDPEPGAPAIIEISARGGTPRSLLKADPAKDVDFHNVSCIPGTNVILYVRHRTDGRTPIMAFDGERDVTVIDEDDTYFATCTWSPTGHILFTKGFGALELWAIPFSPKRMQTTGDAFLVMTNAMMPSVSASGTLAFVRGKPPIGGELVWISSGGDVRSIGEVGKVAMRPIPSPDRARIAFASGDNPGKSDVWIRDLGRNFNTRVSYFETFVLPVSWSPDGTQFAALKFDPKQDPPIQTHFLAIDGSGEVRTPYNGAITSIDSAWRVAAAASDPRLPETQITALQLEDFSELGVLVSGRQIEAFPSLSPDGTLFLYLSSESGRTEVYCTRFPEGTGRWQVSTNGASMMAWSEDSSTVYYESKEGFFRVGITREPELRFGSPEEVFPESTIDLDQFEDIRPVDDRFIAVRTRQSDEEVEPMHISVIENWYEEFREPGSR